MGHIDSIGSDCDIDLESGGNTSEEDGSKDLSLRSDHAMYLLNRTWSGSEGFNGAARCGDGLSFYDEVLSSGQISAENVTMSSEELGEEMVNFLQKKWAKEKRRKLNSEKPPKPPRPPGGPSLDAADMKLVKEISELTMMKRQRTARMKALKKVKAEKKKSSLSNVFAMAVTVLFCLVIIFQGNHKEDANSNNEGKLASTKLIGGLFAEWSSGFSCITKIRCKDQYQLPLCEESKLSTAKNT
ncbi:hypothetical protein RJ639_046722 [Escallonia herrerae]|uniref:Transmembrane protein n=1 Tax=Escallonia herrerae TaxID=1293975 RepID=A0AA88WB73_9ASTE|nr:hypothetical protein RJ639_046722 [Escallonia herrerae]